jgi:hypothetical protein
MLTIIPVTLRREVVFIQMKSSGKHLRRMNGCSNLWWKLISQRWMTNAPLIVFVRWVSQKDTLGAKSRLLKSLAESQSSNLKSREQSFSKRICGSRLLLLSRTSKGSSLSLSFTPMHCSISTTPGNHPPRREKSRPQLTTTSGLVESRNDPNMWVKSWTFGPQNQYLIQNQLSSAQGHWAMVKYLTLPYYIDI